MFPLGTKDKATQTQPERGRDSEGEGRGGEE